LTTHTVLVVEVVQLPTLDPHRLAIAARAAVAAASGGHGVSADPQ
jgi:hypothetical protein